MPKLIDYESISLSIHSKFNIIPHDIIQNDNFYGSATHVPTPPIKVDREVARAAAAS